MKIFALPIRPRRRGAGSLSSSWERWEHSPFTPSWAAKVPRPCGCGAGIKPTLAGRGRRGTGRAGLPQKGCKRQWHSEGPEAPPASPDSVKVGAEGRQAAGRRHRSSSQLSYSPTAKVELRMGRTT